MKLMQTASVLAVCHLVTCKIKNIALILVKIPPDSCIKWLGTGVSSLNALDFTVFDGRTSPDHPIIPQSVT